MAQTLGVLGVVLAVSMVAGTWVGQAWADQSVRDLTVSVDDAASGAVAQVHELTVQLEQQAGSATNDPDTQAAFAAGAELARGVETQLATVQAEADQVAETMTSVVTVSALLVTAALVYQIMVHLGIWTLGRHWRRD